MTPLAALALLRRVEAMPAEHTADPPRVDLWWRISPELPTAAGPRIGVLLDAVLRVLAARPTAPLGHPPRRRIIAAITRT